MVLKVKFVDELAHVPNHVDDFHLDGRVVNVKLDHHEVLGPRAQPQVLRKLLGDNRRVVKVQLGHHVDRHAGPPRVAGQLARFPACMGCTPLAELRPATTRGCHY